MAKPHGKAKFLFPLIAPVLLVGWIGSGTGCSHGERDRSLPAPPTAKKIPVELTEHGDTRVDDYFWLKERENPEVIAYLEAENAYTEAVMGHTAGLRERLYREIVERIPATDTSVPFKKNGYSYATRYEEGHEYPVYLRTRLETGAPEEIFLDVEKMAAGHGYYHVTGVEVSPDNLRLAYGVDTVGRRRYTLRFKDLATGEDLPDEIPDTTGSAAWADDNKTVFYAGKDETLRPCRILRHTLGGPVAEDTLVYEENDPTYETGVYRSRSNRFLFITSYSTLSSETRFLEASDPYGEFRILHPREPDLLYQAEDFGDHFYILTNFEAKNFRLMKAPQSSPGKSSWAELIPHREDVLLEDFSVFRNNLVAAERREGLSHFRVMPWSGAAGHELEFGEAAYAAFIGYNPEIDTDQLRYSYSSLTTPDSTFDYNMTTREKKLLKREQVLGGFDPLDYFTERLTAEARDGEQVPISLVYRLGLRKQGGNPLLLYGYGSYGSSMDASFQSDLLSLLDRGFIYAIAHVRGGQEMGRRWYEEGKLLKKKNTFTDFIDCAESLISRGYTTPDKLFAMGGSAGGLLMGAVVNMRSDLWKGVVAQVPWVDVVTTMLDPSIPLTSGEWDEWGDPRQKKYYDYMLSYSPYDQIGPRDYPAMLVTTGLYDSQVQYWEPAKWVAKLRALKTDGNILLLHTNMQAGHGGASGRFQRYRETAMEYAFMLDLLGIRK
jgi:oligopeptidase B